VSIQVYRIVNRRRVIVKHVGTARSDEEKVEFLLIANEYIRNLTGQLSLFDVGRGEGLLPIDQKEFLGVYHTLYYDTISFLLNDMVLSGLGQGLLLDLVIIRIFEPASKLRSIELLDSYFGVKHRRQGYYDSAPKWLVMKDLVEAVVLDFAKRNYGFGFDILYYDVTTLYFESFKEDGFRTNGFSKDNKSQQPQILVALLVSKEGFPIAYDTFSGNTFEGHTILPVIMRFIAKNGVRSFVVVADAAMISSKNVELLRENGINYIVGARMANLPGKLLEQIDKGLPREDGKTIRLATNYGDLICSYSSKRYSKDKHEMDKQVQKAKELIDNPSKGKRLKFTKANGEKPTLNQQLIDKTIKLLGIKGYYTNIDRDTVSEKLIIDRYHELYKIEQAFRISKHDLQTRPVYHFKEDPIKLHLLICFMALAVSKHIEIAAGCSINHFVSRLKQVTDGRIRNTSTGLATKIRSQISPETKKLLSKIGLLT
jgi:transposase